MNQNNEQVPALTEQLRQRAGVESTFLVKWLAKTGVTDADIQVLLDSGYGKRTLFSYLIANISVDKYLLRAVNKNRSLLTYWDADHTAIKALREYSFRVLTLSEDCAQDKSALYAYLVLRNSSKKTELDYIKKLGRLNNNARLKSQASGGKLYKMAAPYLVTHN